MNKLTPKDRVTGLKKIRVDQIEPNPENWRTHSPEQLSAIAGMFGEVGIAGAALGYVGPNGKVRLIDGHARLGLMDPKAKIPVVMLDVNEEEARKLLLTFDPVGQMAGRDDEMLSSLLDSVSFETDGLNETFQELLAGEIVIEAGADADEAQPEPAGDAPPRPELTPIYQLLITCENEDQQKELLVELAGRKITVRPLVV